MIVWPWPLRASYEDYVVRGVLASIVLHATLVALAVALRKRFPAVTVGIAFFYVALFPSTRLFADPAVLAERFVYLPSVGPAILLAFALAAWVARQGTRLPSVACAVVIAAFGLTTLQRNTAWRSRESLWEAEARTSQDDWRVLLNLSQVRLGQRRFEETIALCDRGIALAPTRTAFQTNRAVALASLGRMADAEEGFAKAAEQSHESSAYANLARLYATTGRKDQAERAYAQAQEHEADPAAREVLDGERLLLCRGDAAGARAAFARALSISPNLQAAKHGLMLVGG